MSSVATTKEDILRLLGKFKNNRKEEYGLLSLGIFGSFARNEATTESDIDIVFETKNPNLFKTVHLKRELEELLDRQVDIIRLRKDMNPRLKKRILQDVRFVE